MKKVILLTATVLFLTSFLPSVGAERTVGMIDVRAMGGIGFPTEPDHFRDGWKKDIGFGGEVRYWFSEMISMAVGFTHQAFKLDQEQYLKEKGILLGAKWEVKGGGALKIDVLSLNFFQSFTPLESRIDLYVMAGGGYYMLKPEDVQVDVTIVAPPFQAHRTTQKHGKTENKPGLHTGLGLEVSVFRNLAFWLEGKTHMIFTKTNRTSFIQTGGGLRLRF